MDESLLPPPAGEKRPFPWRAIALVLVPSGALAAGVGLSRAFDPPQADPVVRWLLWSAGAGAVLGALTGLLRGRAPRWIAYGACAPCLTAALVFLGFRAAEPVREWLADRAEAACRRSGRSICSVREFDQACARDDRAALGPPLQTWCAGASCTRRWTYGGPFRPDTVGARTTLMCSVTTDQAGKPQRSSVMAIARP